MDIRFIKANGIYSPGSAARNYPGGAAAELIRRGIAEPLAVSPTAPQGQQASETTRNRKKYRR